MKYKVFRSYKEAAQSEEGSASVEWALRVLAASPKVTLVECRVGPVFRLGTWAVEASTHGIQVQVRPDDGMDPKDSVGFRGETGKILFTGSPAEMLPLVRAALGRAVHDVK